MDRTAEIQANIDDWSADHRRWLKEAVRECGHHEMYFGHGRCVCCSRESSYVSLEEALSAAYPAVAKTDKELLDEVYMPHGEVQWFGFFGGGPATQKQKSYVRYLLSLHKGNAHAEAVRSYLNMRAADEQGVQVADARPAIVFLGKLPHPKR